MNENYNKCYLLNIIRACCSNKNIMQEDINNLSGFREDELFDELNSVVHRRQIFDAKFNERKTHAKIAEEFKITSTRVGQIIEANIIKLRKYSRQIKIAITNLSTDRMAQFEAYYWLRFNDTPQYTETMPRYEVRKKVVHNTNMKLEDLFDKIIDDCFVKPKVEQGPTIYEVGLSTRAINILGLYVHFHSNGRNNTHISEIAKYITLKKLANIRGCGPNSIKEIITMFENLGYEIKEK